MTKEYDEYEEDDFIQDDGEDSNIPEEGDFKFWLEYFGNKNLNHDNLNLFKESIQVKDNYFLNHPLEVDFTNELYHKIRPGGFLEEDFQKLIDEVPEEKEANDFYKTRIAIAIFFGMKFDLIQKRIGVKNFKDIIESSLVEGFHENYEIPFEKLLSKAYKSSLVTKDDIIDLSFMRGVVLGKRYPEEES